MNPHENSRLRYWLPASPLDKRSSAGTWFVASTPTRSAKLSCYERYDSRVGYPQYEQGPTRGGRSCRTSRHIASSASCYPG